MSEKLNAFKILLATAMGAIGDFLGYRGIMVVVLALCMALDYISGTLAAKKSGEWSSKVAREGLFHKGGTILAVGAAAIVDFLLFVLIPTLPVFGKDIPNTGIFLPLVAAWYILTEIGSVLENSAKMGARVPSWFLKAIAATKKKVDKVGDAQTEEDDPDE